MMRSILALALLVSMPALAADEDVLDSADTASIYPTLIKRVEKKDRDGKLLCGVVVRCKLPSEKECRVQYKSEKVTDSIYTVAYGPGTSQVKRGKNGSLEVKGSFGGDTRAPAPGIPAPSLTYAWEVDGKMSYDEGQKLFTYQQKQSTKSVKSTFNGSTNDAGGFGLPDVTHCAGMTQIAP
jgi:hypothetical protein